MVFAENLSVFSLKLGLRRQLKCFNWNSVLYSEFPAVIRYYILPEFVGLFRLIIQRSNLDGGHLNLDGGKLNLDGGR